MGDGSNLELVLTSRAGLQLGGWEPAGAQGCREHATPLREQQASTDTRLTLKGYCLWEMRHLHPYWLTSAWMAGHPACLKAQRLCLRRLGRHSGQGCGSPALAW